LKDIESSNGERVVVAVIAAFNPDMDFVRRVEVLQTEVDEVIVVNDGSGEHSDVVFDQVSALGALVLHSVKNSGIAAALNSGVLRARQLARPDFILTMDQDSSLDSDYVRKAIATYDSACSAGVNVGLVSAQTFNGVPALKDRSVVERFEIPFDPWQSGMLIPTGIFDSEISFNEEYFIDNVDSEFSLNLKTRDYLPIMGEGCNLLHNLGEEKVGQLFGRKITYTYHSPKRVYYITRNIFFLAQDYLVKCPKWFVRKTFHDILNQSIRFILSADKRSVARMMALGTRDGLLRRAGRFEDKYVQSS
jgi:rhamnosyltransferase